MAVRPAPSPTIHLARWLGSCSPVRVGFFATTAGSLALYAYDACSDSRLAALPQIGTCHCWIVGLAGLVLGMMLASLVLFARWLLAPVIARICEAFTRISAPRAPAIPGSRLNLSVAHACLLAPLAQRRGSRAPPLAV